jgi:ABC-type transporter Mla subunit MlaD
MLWALCWLKNFYPFYSRQHINVIFPNVGGLHACAPVYVDGVHAGSVEKVTWKNNNQVLVRLTITHPRMLIPYGSHFSIFANGVIGARYVDISLPDNNGSEPIPLDESSVVNGDAALRPEIVLDKLGRDISEIDLDKVNERISSDEKEFRKVGNQFTNLAKRAEPVLEHAVPLEDNLQVLSYEMRNTLRKLNNFSDNPKLSQEWRDLIKEAKEAAETAQQAIRELNNMVSDKSLKSDIQNTMVELNQSTAQFEKSVEVLQQVSKDTGLRSDVKEILIDLSKALDKLDRILQNPDSGSDIRATLKSTRSTLGDIDTAARQLQQILDQKHPLIHMFLGRPGHIKVEEIDQSPK